MLLMLELLTEKQQVCVEIIRAHVAVLTRSLSDGNETSSTLIARNRSGVIANLSATRS